MPETISGQSSDPSHGDSEQWIKDTLARVESELGTLAKAVAELASQLAEVARAEEILRRAAAPAAPGRRRAPATRRRGDTVLRVVKAALIAAVSLGVVVAMLAPRHWRDQQYSPRCSVACSRPVAHMDSDGDYDGG